MLMLQFTCDLRVLHSAGPELWWSPTSEQGGGGGEGKREAGGGVPKMFGVGMWPKPVLALSFHFPCLI